MSLIKGLLGLLLVSLPIVGCGGDPLGPGKYVVLEVAYGDQKDSSACNATNTTATTIKSSGDIALYAAGEEVFADIGSMGNANDVTLQGKAGDNDAYTFTGKTVTLQQVGPPNNRVSVTLTETFTLDLTFDGTTATGTLKSTFSCSSNGNECTAVQPPSGCSVTTSFSGERVNDVDLQHDV